MGTLWLVGLDNPALTAELRGLGHTVEQLSLERALEANRSTPDVGWVQGATTGNVALARRLSLHAPTTAWVLLVPPAAALQAEAILDAGATDLAIEPLAAGAAAACVTRLWRDLRSRARLGYLEQSAARGAQPEDVLGESATIKDLLDKIARLARRSAQGPALSVLLTGETGTGKGLFARVLHYAGRRRDGPFIEVNCAALPQGLLEAELFGYERGAFTDAKAARVGLLEAAHGGSVFLDEVTCLPLEGQAKLLTALETRRFRRLGGTDERQVDVQVIAASSHDVAKRVSEGSFRAELLHRLTALWFQLPPLRERGGDAVLLAERLLTKLAVSYQLPVKTLSLAAREAIARHSWPGNVRELYHALERALLAEEGAVIEPADLALQKSPAAVSVEADGSVKVTLPPGGVALAEVEKALVTEALRQVEGNVTRAAALLRVTRDTLRSRIEKLGLDGD